MRVDVSDDIIYAPLPSSAQDLIAHRDALLKHRDALIVELTRVSVRAGIERDGRWCDLLVDAREEDEDACASTPIRGAYSLSPGAERAAALACVQGPTIPMDSYDDEGATVGGLNASETEASGRLDGGNDDDVRRRTIDMASPVFVHDTIAASMHDSGSDLCRQANDEDESERDRRIETKRARIEETPVTASPHAPPLDEVTHDGHDDDIDVPDARDGSPGRVLRFSVDGAASDDSAEKRGTRAECSATSQRVFASTFSSGVPKTVVLNACGDRCSVMLGVVVEFPSDGGASTSQHSGTDEADVDAMDVLVFRVGVSGDARGSSKCLGACSMFKSSTAGRRMSRRRSSLTVPVRVPSADAVFVSSSGRFVFLPHVTDGMRIVRVREVIANDREVPDDEEERLQCGFRVVRVAGERVADYFLLAAAGEEGQCVVWYWAGLENDEEIFTRAPTEAMTLPDVLFRNVAPKPGAPTSLAWIRASSTPKLVVTLDHALVAVWNARAKSLERVSYVMDHNVRCVVPIHFEGLPIPTPDDEDAPIPALTIATKKSAPSESYRSTEDWATVDDDAVRDTNVCATLLRSQGVSIGSKIFDDVFDANALACGNTVACVGTRNGTVLAWNVRTGHVALHTSMDEYDHAMSPEIRRIACHENVIVASCGRRVECFIVDV